MSSGSAVLQLRLAPLLRQGAAAAKQGLGAGVLPAGSEGRVDLSALFRAVHGG